MLRISLRAARQRLSRSSSRGFGGPAREAAGPASLASAGEETQRVVEQVGGSAADEAEEKPLQRVSGDAGVVAPMAVDAAEEGLGSDALVLLTTRDGFAERTITNEVGIIVGTAVASPHVAQYVWATIRTIFGGSIPSYSRLLNECSARAAFNMLREADRAGADAVVNVRYETSITSGRLAGASMFVMCYGTGVKLDEPVTRSDPGLKDVTVTPWKTSQIDIEK